MMLSKEKLSNRGRGKRALAYILLLLLEGGKGEITIKP